MRFLGILFLGGCTLHAQTPISSVVPELPAGKASVPAAGDGFWRLLPEPELDDLVAQTLANSPDLRAFAAQLRQAEAMATVAGAGRFPSLNATVNGAGQPYTPMVLPIPGADLDPDSEVQATFQGQFNLAYEADLFGRARSNAGAARMDAAAARFDMEAMQLVTAAQVVELTLSVYEGREQLRLLAANEAILKKQLAMIQERYRAGLSSILELRQSEEMIATTVAQRPLIEEQVRAAGRTLALMTGGHAGAPRFPKGERVPDLPGPWDGEVSADFVQRRPDVGAAFARLNGADHRLAAALAGRLPSLRLSAAAGLGLMGRTTPDDTLGDALGNSWDGMADDPADAMAWTLSAQLIQPIFMGGAVQAQVGAAKAARDAAIARYQKAVLKGFDEVLSSDAMERAQRTYLGSLKAQRVAVQSSLEAAQKRYQAGLTELRVVLQSQLSLLRVEQAEIRARRQVWSARFRLLRAAAGPLGGSSR